MIAFQVATHSLPPRWTLPQTRHRHSVARTRRFTSAMSFGLPFARDPFLVVMSSDHIEAAGHDLHFAVPPLPIWTRSGSYCRSIRGLTIDVAAAFCNCDCKFNSVQLLAFAASNAAAAK